MIKCKKCGADNVIVAKYCHVCGYKFPERQPTPPEQPTPPKEKEASRSLTKGEREDIGCILTICLFIAAIVVSFCTDSNWVRGVAIGLAAVITKFVQGK